eukprot:2503756-Alexandrium_andersonii.AAC.1
MALWARISMCMRRASASLRLQHACVALALRTPCALDLVAPGAARRALRQCMRRAPVARTPHGCVWIKALRPCARTRHARTCLALVQNPC